ncbi:MAG: DUF4349 domain-containing protein, partial [Gemmataceae bacterium]|nr:DUF4349 domain-containing protein [Gemmataceae bacterium]
EMMAGLFADARPAAGFEDRLLKRLRQLKPAARPQAATWSVWAKIAVSAAALVFLGALGAAVQTVMVQGGLPFLGAERAAIQLANGNDHGGALVTREINPTAAHPDTTRRYNTDRLDELSRVGTMIPDGANDRRERASFGAILGEGGSPRPKGDADSWAERADKGQSEKRSDSRLDELRQLERDKDMKQPPLELSAGAAGGPPRTPSAPPTPARPDAEGVVLTINPTPGREPDYDRSLKARDPKEKAPLVTYFGLPAESPATDKDEPAKTPAGDSRKTADDYFRLTEAERGGDAKSHVSPAKADDRAGIPGIAPKAPGRSGESALGREQATTGNKEAEAEPPATTPPQSQPPAIQRKVIRTGDVEFEVDVFDSAVATVTRLVSAVPGAFVATVNSDKLPNGKVRGSMVVRMPPEHLDKFLLDLRKELSKVGELKGQKIGSVDVTKLYYDLESRLRAARAMEERLLEIIKKGKGEIKDLLAAERELGTWRTKIEEMEGEIRYYNNQISLSTLTIHLEEKEIRAAAAIVVTEHVTLKIETDDVEKSLQTALAAVADAKGRITKSDLKQHAAGQFEAILQFEVAPAAAGSVRDRLKNLGIVTHQDSQRLQQAEGGEIQGEIKSRTSDVRFYVTLYNVANVKPRESHALTVAVADVPTEYRKLQEEVSKAKGQVRLGHLNETDKLHVTAEFDCDIPAVQRSAFDTLLADMGDVLSRTTHRLPPGEMATDRKVGYRLILRSLANIEPRETYTIQLATLDVPAGYRDLQEEVARLKGQVRGGNLNEMDRLDIHAQLDFDLFSSDRKAMDDFLAKLGDVVSRTTARAVPTAIATDRRTAYRLTLRNLSNIQPRESFTLQIAVPDVPAAFRALEAEVAKVKGQVRASQLNEQDKSNVTAVLNFDVAGADRQLFEQLFSKLGDVMVRNTHRAPPNELATERKVGYRLTLKSVNSVPPREVFQLQAVTTDVPGTFRQLQEAVAQAKGHVRSANLDEQDKLNVSATLHFDVEVGERSGIDKVLEATSDVFTKVVSKTLNEAATDRKVGYRLTLVNAAALLPREKVMIFIDVKDTRQAGTSLKDIVRAAGGTVVEEQPELLPSGARKVLFAFNVPVANKDEVVRKFENVGEVRLIKPTRNPKAPETKLSLAHVDVQIASPAPIVPSDQGLTPRLRTSLEYSFWALIWSASVIVMGLMVVLPWALVVWAGVKLVRRWRGQTSRARAVPTAAG